MYSRECRGFARCFIITSARGYSPYRGMENEVKHGEKALSCPEQVGNQHESQRDKSEESSARPLMENVISLSLFLALAPSHLFPVTLLDFIRLVGIRAGWKRKRKKKREAHEENGIVV